MLKLLSDPLGNMRGLYEAVLTRHKESTKRVYGAAWRELAEFLKVRDPWQAIGELRQLKREEANALLFEFRRYMERPSRHRKLKPKSVTTRLQGIESVVSDLHTIGLVPWTVKVLKPKVRIFKDLEGPGAEKLSEVLRGLQDRSDPLSIRNYAIIALLYLHGLRRGEVVSMDLEHVDFDKKRIWILRKGQDERLALDMEPLLEAGLRRWIDVRPHRSEALFINLDRVGHGYRLTGHSIYRMTHHYGLGRPHGIRHTAGTEIARRTKDPYIVKEFLGHADIATSMHYMDHLKKLPAQASKLLADDIRRPDTVT